MLQSKIGLPVTLAAVTVTLAAMLLTPMASAKKRAEALPGSGGLEKLLLPEDSAAPGIRDALPELPDQRYLLKLRGNVLSVYAEGETEASAVYELPSRWLPDYDRIVLEYGLRAENEAELRRLLEDYVS
ncbi:MAG: hypothetical protein K6E36_02715 [Oscillospiraceae bacterium]|nr:hypothetical protein [Oscillospiraceae bacterium]MCR5305399.1 hypothetical protein [Oscillospiraceae bacterium]